MSEQDKVGLVFAAALVAIDSELFGRAGRSLSVAELTRAGKMVQRQPFADKESVCSINDLDACGLGGAIGQSAEDATGPVALC